MTNPSPHLRLRLPPEMAIHRLPRVRALAPQVGQCQRAPAQRPLAELVAAVGARLRGEAPCSEREAPRLGTHLGSTCSSTKWVGVWLPASQVPDS